MATPGGGDGLGGFGVRWLGIARYADTCRNGGGQLVEEESRHFVFADSSTSDVGCSLLGHPKVYSIISAEGLSGENSH